MTDIIIVVQGGVVQKVAASGKDVRVLVVDWDDISASAIADQKPHWMPVDKLSTLALETQELCAPALQQ